MNRLENINTGSNHVADLAKKAQQGENGAFGAIYDLFFEKIYRFVYFRVSHQQTAEDLTEDVFVKAYQKISAAKDLNRFEAWLYQIARNRVIDHYRSAKITINLEEISDLPDVSANLQSIFQKSENFSRLMSLIKLLKPIDRQLVQLKFFEELDNKTISELLGKSEGALRVALHRALANLKKISEKF